MPDRLEKLQKSPTLQAVVQFGEVGFYPYNSLSVSALFHSQAERIIGAKEDPITQKQRNLSEIKVSGKSLSIEKKLMGGFTDAFYRGKLPELIIVTSGMMETPEFIEEYLDFLEKLCILGFLSEPELEEVSLLDRYVPQLIIASYGMVYNVILQKLETALETMAQISPRNKDRLVQKISRAMFTNPDEGYDLSLVPLTLFKKPVALNLAGSKSIYTVKTTQLLEKYKIPCQFNPNGKLGILEWELNQAYKHLTHRIIPLLQLQEAAMDLKDTDVTALMETLGQKLGVLPGLTTLASSSKNPVPVEQLSFSTLDLAMVHQIGTLAQKVNFIELQNYTDALLQTIQPLVKSTPSAMSLKRSSLK